MGGDTTGIALDLAEPKGIDGALAEVGQVDHLILAAIERDQNTVKDFDVERAVQIVTLKLVGYTEVVHVLGRPPDSGQLHRPVRGGQNPR